MRKTIFVIFILFYNFSFSKDLHFKSGPTQIGEHQEISKKSLGVSGGSVRNQDLIIQFDSKISSHHYAFLESQGFLVHSYLPEDALLVTGSLALSLKLEASSQEIIGATLYMPEWKLSPEFSNLSVLDKDSEILIHVKVLSKYKAEDVKTEILKQTKLNFVDSVKNEIIFKGSKFEVLKISEINGVEFVQEFLNVSTMDFKIYSDAHAQSHLNYIETKTGYESGTKLMNFEPVWEKGFTGKNQVIAFADTGVDLGYLNNMHRDLVNIKKGIAAGALSISWEDPSGHGTHVAGSLAGTGKLSNGRIKGGAFDAQLIAQGLWSLLHNNISLPFNFWELYKSSYELGARIHSNSWGIANKFGIYDNYAASIDEFSFEHPDFLVVIAAGNNAGDYDQDGVVDLNSLSPPSSAKNALTVGASENRIFKGGSQGSCGQAEGADQRWSVAPLKSDRHSNNPNGIACFSSRGPTQDGRIKPDIVAPGTNIVSTRSRHKKADSFWGDYNKNYVWGGGTSMATPLVASAAAVVRQALQGNNEKYPSASLVKAFLIHSAFDLFPGQFGYGLTQEMKTPKPNFVQGYGRVDVAKAVDFESLNWMDEKLGVGVGESKTYEFNVELKSNQKAPKQIRATLVYTDAPATSSSGVALVNDLDLKLESPTGQVYQLADRINNVEMVEAPFGGEGVYKVQISGINVPSGKNSKQPFSIVFSAE